MKVSAHSPTVAPIAPPGSSTVPEFPTLNAVSAAVVTPAAFRLTPSVADQLMQLVMDNRDELNKVAFGELTFTLKVRAGIWVEAALTVRQTLTPTNPKLGPKIA